MRFPTSSTAPPAPKNTPAQCPCPQLAERQNVVRATTEDEDIGWIGSKDYSWNRCNVWCLSLLHDNDKSTYDLHALQLMQAVPMSPITSCQAEYLSSTAIRDNPD